jgi:hypothetical protein
LVTTAWKTEEEIEVCDYDESLGSNVDCEDENWIELAENRVQRRTLVFEMLELQVLLSENCLFLS